MSMYSPPTRRVFLFLVVEESVYLAYLGSRSTLGQSQPTRLILTHGAMVAQFAHNERAVGSSPAGSTHGDYGVVVTLLFVKQPSSVRT